VDAVKVPNAYQRRAEAGGDVLEFVEDMHQEQLLAPSSIQDLSSRKRSGSS
jgi:hypothetical protein